jgi:hypothetical protein
MGVFREKQLILWWRPGKAMTYNIEAVPSRTDLAPLVATWLVKAFGHPGGLTQCEMTALILAPPDGPEETFVLFKGWQAGWDGKPGA